MIDFMGDSNVKKTSVFLESLIVILSVCIIAGHPKARAKTTN